MKLKVFLIKKFDTTLEYVSKYTDGTLFMDFGRPDRYVRFPSHEAAEDAVLLNESLGPLLVIEEVYIDASQAIAIEAELETPA